MNLHPLFFNGRRPRKQQKGKRKLESGLVVLFFSSFFTDKAQKVTGTTKVLKLHARHRQGRGHFAGRPRLEVGVGLLDKCHAAEAEPNFAVGAAYEVGVGDLLGDLPAVGALPRGVLRSLRGLQPCRRVSDEPLVCDLAVSHASGPSLAISCLSPLKVKITARAMHYIFFFFFFGRGEKQGSGDCLMVCLCFVEGALL